MGFDYKLAKQINVQYGLCVHCGNRAEKGQTLCLEHKMRNREYKSTRNKEKDKATSKERYEFRKANGICTVCGKRPKEKGLLCQTCSIKQKLKRDKLRASKGKVNRLDWTTYGMCYICGCKELVPGKKVCKACYGERLKAIDKAAHMDKWEKNRCKFVI